MKNTNIHTFIISLFLLVGQIIFAQTADTVDRDWYSLTQKIEAIALQGKKIRLKAAVRVEVKDTAALAALWLRVDKTDGKTGFFYNMYNQPIKNAQWKYYTINGTVDSNAKSISFGGLCFFSGKFYFDDFTLAVEENGKWKNIALDNASFEQSKVWKTGVGRNEVVVRAYKNQIVKGQSPDGKNYCLIQGTNVSNYGNDAKVGKYFETNQVKLYYEIYGFGKPLLLLHGNGQSIEAMRNQIDFFKNKYQVIVPDCRGRGKSTDTEAPLTYDIQASDMNNLLNHLKIDSASIIGWSDGGIIGLIMAKDYPSKVKKLIASGANVLQDTTAYFPKHLAEFHEAVMDTSLPIKYKKLYSLMIDYPNIAFIELGKIKCPTMIVAGDKDEIRIGHTVKIFESIPNAQLFIVPGTSHYVLSENAKVFNAAALKFLNQ
jgi:pimeloyl-ACP methyl ester carboxylesterase